MCCPLTITQYPLQGQLLHNSAEDAICHFSCQPRELLTITKLYFGDICTVRFFYVKYAQRLFNRINDVYYLVSCFSRERWQVNIPDNFTFVIPIMKYRKTLKITKVSRRKHFLFFMLVLTLLAITKPISISKRKSARSDISHVKYTQRLFNCINGVYYLVSVFFFRGSLVGISDDFLFVPPICE